MEPSEAASKNKPAQVAIMPLAYFPPIKYFQLMLKHKSVVFDVHEHFHKQFFYNRCVISGPNGAQKLSIPIIHKGVRTALKDVRISYESNWRAIHWRGFEAAYRRSPYFEFYEHYFSPIYSDFKPTFLFEWNMKLLEIMNTIFGNKIHFSFTTEYIESYPHANDYRALAAPSVLAANPIQIPKYLQVFEERNGFINNLSIVDLLFCEGNNMLQYLK